MDFSSGFPGPWCSGLSLGVSLCFFFWEVNKTNKKTKERSESPGRKKREEIKQCTQG
jgi:hypothetical protein